MDKDTLQHTYQGRKKQFEKDLSRQKRVLLYISILRLLVIVLAVWFLVAGVKNNLSLLWIISILMVVLFFALVSYHKNQNDRKKLLMKLVQLNAMELDCLDYSFGDNDPGNSFIDSQHPWSFDLDLFGEGSIFQYLNRTATHSGPRNLADLITSPVTDPEELTSRQEMTRELAEKVDLRQFFIANAMLMKSEVEDYKDVIGWSEEEVFIEKYRWTKVVPWVMGLLSSAALIATIINPVNFMLFLPILLINLTLLSPFLNRTNRYQAKVSRKHRFLNIYAVLLEMLAREKFEHPELKRIAQQSVNASKSLRKLTTRLDLFDQRLNILVGFTANALFLFDFIMLHRLAAWSRSNKGMLEQWLSITGLVDARISLAGFAYNHPEYSYPRLEKNFTGIKAVDLGHPMILPGKRIDNDIVIQDEKVVLITGANMAGKSTFLRSVGVNMALAYAGSPVCAKEFITGPYQLYSSMRTSDSLKDDESYFYAEIKRLKSIVEKMEAGTKLLILLDEVLKGTNTTDKQKGSKGLILKSIEHDVLCFIATHDLALGALQDAHQGKVVNYCFESYIDGLELTFDYKMQEGLAKNMNASFLMKQMGIMD